MERSMEDFAFKPDRPASRYRLLQGLGIFAGQAYGRDLRNCRRRYDNCLECSRDFR
jgi:hypothetical protein